MKICLYTDTALPKMGGQEMVVDALARHFLDLDQQITVLAPLPRKLTPCDDRFPYEIVRHTRFFSTQFFIAWYRRYLAQEYRRRPFDILHCHGIYPGTYLASLLGHALPVPMIVTSHGGDVFQDNVRLKKPIIRERCRQGLRHASALVAISRFTRAGFARICPEAQPRIVDIPNGVHLRQFEERVARPADLDFSLAPGSYALFLGRLKHRKGVDVLLHALARTPANGSVQLAIVGDGEERPALEVLADQLDLAGRVLFLGTLTGQAKSYVVQNARFGVVPSRQWEAFGLVVLEGHAAGLPMLTSEMPGLADLVRPEENGLIVPPEDPAALAAALTRLFTDDALVHRLAAQARAAVQQYDWRNIAMRHLDLYERVLGERKRLAA